MSKKYKNRKVYNPYDMPVAIRETWFSILQDRFEGYEDWEVGSLAWQNTEDNDDGDEVFNELGSDCNKLDQWLISTGAKEGEVVIIGLWRD